MQISTQARDGAFMAVDGGGTGCRARLRVQGQQMDHQLAGNANLTTDRDSALRLVDRLITEMLTGAPQISRADLRLHLGLAGVLDSSIAPHVADRLGVPGLTLSDDQLTTLVGALGDQDGLLLGLGTGSFAAAQIAGQRRIIGGWGHVLGDEAGGAWIGKRLLSRTLHVADGLATPSPLTEAMQARFGTALDIVTFARDAGPADFAALAPMLLATPEDPAAQAILAEGSTYLLTALRALGWRKDGPDLCLVGGVASAYAPLLAQSGLRVVAPLGDALDGGLRLASESP